MIEKAPISHRKHTSTTQGLKEWYNVFVPTLKEGLQYDASVNMQIYARIESQCKNEQWRSPMWHNDVHLHEHHIVNPLVIFTSYQLQLHDSHYRIPSIDISMNTRTTQYTHTVVLGTTATD